MGEIGGEGGGREGLVVGAGVGVVVGVVVCGGGVCLVAGQMGFEEWRGQGEQGKGARLGGSGRHDGEGLRRSRTLSEDAFNDSSNAIRCDSEVFLCRTRA